MISEDSKHKTKARRELSIYKCLEEIKSSWEGDVGGLIQDWGKIAGEQLASNCTPLNIQNKVIMNTADTTFLQKWKMKSKVDYHFDK